MYRDEPCFAAHNTFQLGKELVGTLRSTYGQSTVNVRGCVRVTNRPCVLFLPSPEPLNGPLLRIVDRDVDDANAPVLDSKIREWVKDTISVVCPHKTTFVIVDAEQVRERFDILLAEVIRIFLPSETNPEADILVVGTQRLHDHAEPIGVPIVLPDRIPVQTSGGWDPDLL